MEIVMLIVELLRRVLQKAGPYLAVEMILPGGTLLALLLYLYRHRKNIFGRDVDLALARSTSQHRPRRSRGLQP
jgi:hypothetical protein